MNRKDTINDLMRPLSCYFRDGRKGGSSCNEAFLSGLRVPFSALYGYTFDTVHDPGFYSEIATVRLETNLYDVKTEKLLWSGQSQSEDVQSISKLIDDVIALVIKELQKNKLLPAKN